jgi:hypothetical protein
MGRAIYAINDPVERLERLKGPDGEVGKKIEREQLKDQ